MTTAVTSTFSVDGLDIDRITSSPQFVIEKIREYESPEGWNAVELEFRCSDPMIWASGGKLTFRPDLKWALARYVLNVRKSDASKIPLPGYLAAQGEMRYQKVRPDFIFASTTESKVMMDDGSWGPSQVTIVKNINRKEIPDNQFTMSAFGLPELYKTTTPGINRIVLVLTGVGLLLLIWYLVARRDPQAQHRPLGNEPM
jgi:hypothetical protein